MKSKQTPTRFIRVLSDFWHSGLHLVILFVICLTLYWYTEADPYRFSDSEYEKQVIKAGEEIRFTRHFCSNKSNVGLYLYRFIVDESNHYRLIDQSPYPPLIGCGNIGLRKPIPSDVVDGKYNYVVIATYNINPMIRATKTLQPIEFEVRNGN